MRDVKTIIRKHMDQLQEQIADVAAKKKTAEEHGYKKVADFWDQQELIKIVAYMELNSILEESRA